MTSSLLSYAAGADRTADETEGAFEPGLVVDAVLRLLARERVPVAISSILRAQESATRLLRDLGVAPAPMSPNAAYWWGVADAILGCNEGPGAGQPGVSDDRSSDTPSGTPRRPRRTGGRP